MVDIGSVASAIITILLLTVVYGGIFFLSIINKKKGLTLTIFVGVAYTISLVAYIFSLFYVFVLSICVSTLLIYGYATGSTQIKKFIKNTFKGSTHSEQNKGVEKIFDKVEFYDIVESSVKKFSETKTGALLTFEKGDSLKEYIKANGVEVKAPLSQALLETIFYEGTRLHDGGVVIKDDIIEAAAVMYPSNREHYDVKYGARHRAAMGISKVTDSVTVVVSEETGRISIAVGGELQTVTQENFLTVFINYMNQENDAE